MTVIDYDYRHQTKFNDKEIAFHGVSHMQQYCKGGTLLQDNATI